MQFTVQLVGASNCSNSDFLYSSFIYGCFVGQRVISLTALLMYLCSHHTSMTILLTCLCICDGLGYQIYTLETLLFVV